MLFVDAAVWRCWCVWRLVCDAGRYENVCNDFCCLCLLMDVKEDTGEKGDFSPLILMMKAA